MFQYHAQQKDSFCSDITHQDLDAIQHYKNKQDLLQIGIDPNHCYLYNLMYVPNFEVKGSYGSYKISDLLELVNDLDQSDSDLYLDDIILGYTSSYSMPHAYDPSYKFGFSNESINDYLQKLEEAKFQEFKEENFPALLKSTLIAIQTLMTRLNWCFVIIREDL